jgi:hypothetical protein
MTHSSQYDALTRWPTDDVQQFLSEHAEGRARVVEQAFERLSRFIGRTTEELPVCFLGKAAVGKSTLINALVAGGGTLLPQGGVGPLTAQATVVRHGSRRAFRARYLSAQRLNRVVFALERSVERDAARPPDLDEEAALEAEAAQVDPDDQSTTSKVDAYRKMAALMVRGDQFEGADTRYLCDRLRECMGGEAPFGTAADPQDTERLERVRAVLDALRANKDHVHDVELVDDERSFLLELEAHASGFLAPMIRTLEVEWNAPFMEGGLVIVDLPGVGVANDEYRQVTAEWIRKARAIVLVVDRAGVTDASVDLLRETGFLNSMLHESLDEDADPPILMVAAVKVDLSATDARSKDKQLHGKQARPWVTHFDEYCDKLEQVIAGQLRSELEKVVHDGAEETLEQRRAVMDSLLQRLRVHPLSAHEYRLFVEDDDEDRPHVKTAEQSRVPQFQEALAQVVGTRRDRIRRHTKELADDAEDKARGALKLIHAQWTREDLADEEARQLAADLDEVTGPLLRELHVRQGGFRAFLNQQVPAKIEASTHTASQQALKSIRSYLRKLKGYHWATLRAAVRRSGTFVGARHVELPNELTLRFEDPVAVVWDKDILKELRRETKAVGDDYVRLVGNVVDWAREEGARVKPDLVEALHSNLKADTRDLGRVGREAVKELRQHVKVTLAEKVHKTIQDRCDRFVRDQQDVGAGVQRRMHEMLDDLAEEVVAVAQPAASKVLLDSYDGVAKEIRAAFEDYPDPIEQARSAIVSDHERYLRRSNAQRRRHVLERCGAYQHALDEASKTA